MELIKIVCDTEVYIPSLRCMDTIPQFSTNFTKRGSFRDFLIVSHEDVAFQMWDHHLK